MAAEFDADGRLVSQEYGDVYFAAEGVAETEHVFCGGNDLAARFAAESGTFVVAETGFGTGLNFLVVAELFDRVAPESARLVFVSVDERVLPDDVLGRVHGVMGERFSQRAARLRRALAGGSTELREHRVTLRLLVGDALSVLRGHTWHADAWLLDGFAPAKNPSMWTPALLREVGERTANGGTFATFTVAGVVRRGLEAAGFDLERREGFGRKREMLCGRRPSTDAAPWFDQPFATAPEHVVVHGAGIAGAGAAHAFLRRGARVTLVEPCEPAAGASGLPAAVVRPRLWIGDDVPDAALVTEAFRWTTDWLRRFHPEQFEMSGVLQLATDARTAEASARRAANPETADLVEWCEPSQIRERFGLEPEFGACFVPGAGHVDLGELTRRICRDDRIERRDAASDLAVDLHVLASARDARCAFLPTEAARGQACRLEWSHAAAPAVVLSAGGYLIPSRDRRSAWIGATYDRGDEDGRVHESDDERVLREFAALDGCDFVAAAEVRGRFAAVRMTTPDRLPYVGAVPEPDAFRDAFGAAIRSRAHRAASTRSAWRERTVATLAHGSRGSVTGPFAGEILAARAFGEPVPLAPHALARLHPARALVRSIRRD